VALSCLVLVVVGSMSYRPISVEDEVRRFASQSSWALRMRAGDDAPTIEVSDFHESRPDAQPYERDYRFKVLVLFPDVEKAKIGPDERKRAAEQLTGVFRGGLRYLEHVKVTPEESQEPNKVVFVVTSQGSKVKLMKDWPHEPTIFFVVPISVWHAPLGQFVHFWEDTIVNTLGAAVALLISTIITAFFIPNMLRKGSIDLLIVKPIHRTTLLVYKYIGGLLFMFLNTAFVVGGIWLILGVRTGIWGPGFLASILVLTFQFALYYAVSTLVGVVTRSAIAAILVACFSWFVFSFVIGNGYQILDATRKIPAEFAGKKANDDEPDDQKKEENLSEPLLPGWVYTIADIIHFVTPRLKDLDALTNKLILDATLPESSNDRKIADKLFATFNWTEALSVTVIYIVALLALSCWWFATKDY
jgi:ABC-type transport system involved in multi-copper enzyme maturation permease subunit